MDRTAEIAKLEKLLNSGVSTVSVDGVNVALDVDAIRRRLRELRLEDDTQKARRPVASIIKLG